jgi:hypothetical protein
MPLPMRSPTAENIFQPRDGGAGENDLCGDDEREADQQNPLGVLAMTVR